VQWGCRALRLAKAQTMRLAISVPVHSLPFLHPSPFLPHPSHPRLLLFTCLFPSLLSIFMSVSLVNQILGVTSITNFEVTEEYSRVLMHFG
jgi:hypothetical protein